MFCCCFRWSFPVRGPHNVYPFTKWNLFLIRICESFLLTRLHGLYSVIKHSFCVCCLFGAFELDAYSSTDTVYSFLLRFFFSIFFLLFWVLCNTSAAPALLLIHKMIAKSVEEKKSEGFVCVCSLQCAACATL